MFVDPHRWFTWAGTWDMRGGASRRDHGGHSQFDSLGRLYGVD